ncbi:hypothetical protein GCM10010293_40640 [Streptomyces griseoflavus]|uniref:hypothetical protein n=1 Tax=Streptomyces griseoflavus TaxID=35619 RepID=UPI00167D07D3|nr:hypothetical protein [Streptomyces griseoflavus]GGV37005.1 hypothetical protein GCM10010293_40640 [Streptomyces griseoflavus]
MHDHPTPEDGYEWPTCVTPRCKRQLWVAEANRWACRPCEDATAQRIRELPALFAQLDTTAALMRGSRRPGGATSGSKTPPIPPRLEVLALVGPGGIDARLSAIEDAWRSALGWTIAPWRGSPKQAIPHLVEFLSNNLLWACSSYEEIGQDIDDLRKLHAECAALAAGEKRPGRVQIGLCPTVVNDNWCGTQLTASTGSHRIHCPECGNRWETLGEWRELRAAQERVLAEAAGVAA